MPLDLKSTTEEKVPIRVNPTTTTGKPAKIDGLAVISITAGNATAAPATQAELDADTAAGGSGLVGFVVSEDTAGQSSYQVSADADLGAGVTTITDGGVYVYNDPQAANLGLGSSAPVPKAA